ncbi:hypothetical protein ACFC34_41060, partial [Streptomyces sp. NPDC056053]|uniref:hypothetical protein n=1 Tax=Streptomyces sp. NPDC056053 TaxID=3345696 RepID=UPI0035DA1D63
SGSIRSHIASVITNRTDTSDQLINPSRRHALDGALGWAIVQEHEHTPAELDTLTQRILARGAETAAQHRQENNAE